MTGTDSEKKVELPELSELWSGIMQWLADQEPGRLDLIDGLWKGETPDWNVEVNGHPEEVDGVGPYGIRLVHKVYVSMGVLEPFGGALAAANEDDLIKHFAAQRRADQ